MFDDLEKLLRCYVYERILESSREVYVNGAVFVKKLTLRGFGNIRTRSD